MKKPFPIPEAVIDGRCTWYVIHGGSIKYIFIDRNAAANGKPCWMIYVPEEDRVHRAKEWRSYAEHGSNDSQVFGRGNRNSPLLPDGPAFWVETLAAIEVTV